MFDAKSRYMEIEDTFYEKTPGELIRYKKRRFIPKDKEEQLVLSEFDIVSGDRIDLVSFKYFGDPEQYWRLCDMNGIMHPLDLTREIGKTIIIKGDI
jgi:hypothetical protein